MDAAKINRMILLSGIVALPDEKKFDHFNVNYSSSPPPNSFENFSEFNERGIKHEYTEDSIAMHGGDVSLEITCVGKQEEEADLKSELFSDVEIKEETWHVDLAQLPIDSQTSKRRDPFSPELLQVKQTTSSWNSSQKRDATISSPSNKKTTSETSESLSLNGSALYSHVSQKHRDKFRWDHYIKPFACTICGISYKTHAALQNHHWWKHRVKRLKCDFSGCNSTYTYSAAFAKHRAQHTNENIPIKVRRRQVYLCDHCNRTFCSNQALHSHVNRKHSKYTAKAHHAQFFQCDYCQKFVSSKAVLSVHINSKHVNSKIWKCSHCNFETVHQSSLYAHVALKHRSCRYECDLCKKKFSLKPTLKQHIVNMHNSVPQICTICGVLYKNSASLNSHYRKLHANEILKCNWVGCSRSFIRSSDFERHKAEHFTRCNSLSQKCLSGEIFGNSIQTDDVNSRQNERSRYKNCTTKLKESTEPAVSTNESPQSGPNIMMNPIKMNPIVILKRIALPLDKNEHLKNLNFMSSTPSLLSNVEKSSRSNEEDRFSSDAEFKKKTLNIDRALQPLSDSQVLGSGGTYLDCSQERREICCSPSNEKTTETHHCSHCHFKTLNRDLLKSHELRKHCFMCHYCRQILPTRISLLVHIQTHNNHEEKREIYNCPHCEYKTTDTSALRGHVLAGCKFECNYKQNHIVENVNCDFVECHKSCEGLRAFRMHKIVHATAGTGKLMKVPSLFLCAYCHKKFDTRTDVRLHVSHKHPKNAEKSHNSVFQCDHCKKVLTTKFGLITHMNYQHLNKFRTYSCSHCDFKTIHGSAFYGHVAQKQRIHRFECDYCSKSFGRKSDLKTHIIFMHSSLRQTCTICNRQLKHYYSLLRHYAKLHASNIFKCGYVACGRIFLHLRDFERHKAKHSVEERKAHRVLQAKRQPN